MTRPTSRTVTRLILGLALLSALSFSVLAADDPSIQGDTRAGIHQAMQQHVEQHTVEGMYSVYDAKSDQLRQLKLQEMHSGIVKKGDFYVSCADFVDADGHKIDLDFLVLEGDGSFKTVETIVHKIDGDKRPYDLEN